MTEEQVMKDLKDIKGYFAAIKQFKRDSSIVAPVRIMKVVESYTKIMEQAGSDEYIIFTEMYVHGASQADMAAFWGISREGVKYRHKKFVKFLIEMLEKEGK